MNSPKISVIVPVYNVEEYLDRCVTSIIEQTFRDTEIILVDDGSTDNSGSMCDSWSEKDSRIRVIHKENGGLSDARNAGIEASCGEYLIFIDSDDFIEPTMLRVLYDLIKEYVADIAICGLYNCYESGRVARSTESNIIVCSGIEALEYVLRGDRMSVEVPTKLIRRTQIGNLRFIKGKTSEDAFFTPELLMKTEKVVETPEPLYNYWHRSGSITTSPFKKEGMHVIEAYERMYGIAKNSYPQLLNASEFRLLWANFIVLDRILNSPDYSKSESYYTVVKYLKNNWLKAVRNSYFRRSRRISAIALKINVRLYKFLSVMNSKRYKELK